MDSIAERLSENKFFNLAVVAVVLVLGIYAGYHVTFWGFLGFVVIGIGLFFFLLSLDYSPIVSIAGGSLLYFIFGLLIGISVSNWGPWFK